MERSDDGKADLKRRWCEGGGSAVVVELTILEHLEQRTGVSLMEEHPA